MLYLESINKSLHNLMDVDSQVILIGEDLLDAYGGGAFKVSKGLSTKFPKQVISTPISEQSITGAAIGMSMRGMKPIVEIMFGDFLTLCVDQIVNHATKYHWMYDEQVSVPVVIRAPMGGGRGYGPTHSQSLESMFMTVPGLNIIAPSIFHNPGEILKKCVLNEQHPCLFIENKISYPKTIQRENRFGDYHIERVQTIDGFENILLRLYKDEKPDVLIITYGGMAELAVKCAYEAFMDEEILVNVLVIASLKPIPKDPIIAQANRASCVLVIEEGNQIGGWGAEISSVIHENVFSSLNSPVMRLGAKDSPIPSSMNMESEVLPTLSSIKKSIMKLVKSV
jgi:pyruvate/2-oxoglutarate/acetoin dehydrogenase E1 component